MKMPKPHHPLRLVRRIVAIALLAAVALGIALGADAGTLCAWCPLGFAQTSLASREFHAAILLPLVIVIAVAALFGRAFCSWGCPSSLIKKRSGKKIDTTAQPPKASPRSASTTRTLQSIAPIAGVLLASFIVGFPVFCLFCPIGLAFGFMFAIFRSLTVYQPSWDLIIFPLMLIIELRLFGSWCSRICPLGAAAGLIARISPLRFRTKADPATCRIDSTCHACSDACSESIATPSIVAGTDASCSLCLECKTGCPHESLSIVIDPHIKTNQGEKEEPLAESTK